MAGGDGGAPRPPGAEHPRGRPVDGDRQAQTLLARGAGADPGRRGRRFRTPGPRSSWTPSSRGSSGRPTPPPSVRGGQPRVRRTPRSRPSRRRCCARVRREAGLAYELLATRGDLQAIVAARRAGEEVDVRTLRGWRRELVGAELLALLDGRISLAVEREGGHARPAHRRALTPPGPRNGRRRRVEAGGLSQRACRPACCPNCHRWRSVRVEDHGTARFEL